MSIILKKANKMKIIIILGLIILTTLSCKAQIVPIEKKIEYIRTENGIPENITYLKDINNLLDKYVGVWKGIFNDKTYEFKIIKITEKPGRINEDKLLMRYIITDINGTVIENTSALPNNSPYVIHGDYIDRSNYLLNYVGSAGNCGQAGTIFISTSIKSNYTRLYLSLEPEQMLISTEDCPNGGASQIIPKNQITLIKQ